MVFSIGSPSARLFAFAGCLVFGVVQALAGVTVVLSASPNPAQLSQSVTLTATASPLVSTGRVTFYDHTTILGTVSISNGTATLTTAGLGAGSHALYARYVVGFGQSSNASNQVSEIVNAKPGGGFVPFEPAFFGSYPQPTIPFNGTFAGDLNHDGYPDLVTTSSYGNSTGETLSVFVNKGNSTFTGPTNYLNAGNCYDVMIADMDLDGNQDLVAATNQGVALLRGKGDGTFGSPSSIESTNDVTWVAVADVNSDGIPDLVVAHSLNAVPTRIEVLLGNGEGSFDTSVSTTLAYYVSTMTWGDFNGDGIPDLAVGSAQGGRVGILLGHGDGSFQPPLNYTIPLVSSLVAGDLNADGITDLAVGSGPLITVLLGNGDGNFRAMPEINVDPVYGGNGGTSIRSLAIADLNGDGKMDLVAAYTYLMMLPGNGDGTFAPPYSLPPLGGSAYDASSISVADFDHDGVADLAMGPGYQFDDWGYLGKPAPVFSLSASPNPASNSTKEITLTVTSSSADATGTLQFQDISGFGTDLGSVPVSGGGATLQMANPGTGTYVVVATYSGDSKYVETKTPQLPVLIQQPGPAIILTASPNPAQVGQEITLTATLAYSVPGNPRIGFFDGTTPLNFQTLYSTPATFKTTLAAGTHQLRAVFPEYFGYLSTSGTFSEQVLASTGGQLTPGPGFNTGGIPGAMITADVDQDGFADIVFADSNPDQIGVLTGAGSGTFSGPDRTPLSFAPGALVASQFDSFGWTDLAVTNPAGNSVVVLLHESAGFYYPLPQSFPVGTNPIAIATADFNGDGAADLVTANSGSNDASVLLTTTGPGNFGKAVNHSAGTQPVAVVAGDFNGDGKADFAVADHGSSDLRVFLGNGDGTFRTPSTISVASGPVALASADLNGDGYTDLVVLSAGAGQVSVLLGKANGTFATPVAYNVASGPTAVTIADLDGDGKLDLAVSTSVGMLVFYGKGNGSFGPASTYSLIAGATALVAGDFGEAGHMDLAALSPPAKAVLLSLYRVPTTTTLAVTRNGPTVNVKVTMAATVSPAVTGGFVSFYDGVHILASAPVTGGLGSAFVTSLPEGLHAILARFTGSPGYGPSVSASSNFTSSPVSAGGLTAAVTQILSDVPGNFAVGDFNSDGNLDLAMWGQGNGLYGLLGHGDGTFSGVTSSQASGGSSLLACDFNGDGKPDVAYLFTVNSPVIALGHGDGTFNTVNPLESYSVTSFAAADVNRDGKPDLIFTDPNGFVQVLRGNGDGSLEVLPAGYPAGANPSAIAVGDFNNDGIADVVVTNSGSAGPNTISVLLGNADGSFGPPQAAATDLNPQSLVLGDFDGDGNLDVVVIHATQSTMAILLGKGDGTFKPAAIVPLGAVPTQIFSADMNGDGVTDLILFYARSSTAFSILYGNGNGTFQTPLSFQELRTPYSMAIADVNGDGRPDVVIGSNGTGGSGVDVYLNGPVQAAPSPLRFIPIAPCRVADTRNATDPLGGPAIAGGMSRSFTLPSSTGCGIPTTAAAYSLNVAVVPQGKLGYLTVWPSGQTRPVVATLNSTDGRVKSVGAIIPAGTSGAISVYATNTTDLVLDINGYFVPATTPSALAFYPVTPCRVADTRRTNGPLGGPYLTARSTRAFPILNATACNISSSAQAYSVNLAVVPRGGPVGYLTAWADGQTQPVVATLNDPTGTILSNAAIVPAGNSGQIDVYTTNNTDLVIDINGYFAPPGTGGLLLYTLTPCRVLDTRQPPGSQPFTGTLNVNVEGSSCVISGTAQSYIFNATLVPPGKVGYLTLWPQGTMQPVVANLNDTDGTITGNMAVVPTSNGSISAYVTNPTQLVLDIFGYFAP